MRPGRPDDIELLLRRFRVDALERRREFASPGWLAGVMSDFDWAAKCRVVEDRPREEGLVVVFDRSTAAGTVTRIEASSSTGEVSPLLEWGLRFSRAAGAVAAQVWRPPGQSEDLGQLGLTRRRPFWRMDRSSLDSIPEVPATRGYRVISQDIEPRPVELWVQVFNRAFSEHFNHSPLTTELFQKRYLGHPDLLLMAVTDQGEPAALVLGQLDDLLPDDPRLGPLGIVGIVATLPEHRRRGLAAQLTAECLRRLRSRGAGSASLHVDAMNADRAFDLYRRLGFEVGFELEVWERRI